MKTKIKRHSRSVLAVVLTLCMLISCMTVGIIATDAAKTADERVGAVDDSESVGAVDDSERVGAVDDSERVGAVDDSERVGAGVQTYAVTLQADSSTYGSLTATYVDGSGSSVTTSAITDSTMIAVKQGEVVSLKATAGDSGNFDGWTVDSGTYQRSSLTPLSAAEVNIMPTSDLSMTAHFSFMGTSTSYCLLRSTDNQPANMSNSGLTVYNKSDGYYVTIPASSMNGTNNVYFAISDSDSYTGMWNQDSRDTILVSVASGSASYIEAEKQNCYVGSKGYDFARARLKVSSVSSVTLHMWQTNDGKTLNYEFSVGDSGSGGGGDDTPSTTGYTNLYVLDGIRGDKNANGTNLFGDTIIYSSNSGVLKKNYYDATGGAEFVKESVTDGNYYYYKHDEDLDFRVQTTIKNGHQAIGVRAFVMNGRTYPAKKGADGKYYADITLEADTYASGHYLEVIPVYYNTLIPDSDYIKFYVDANTIGNKFGETIGYSLWYTDTALHGMEGAYPGQPLMSDGSLLYGYFPEYYVDVNASVLPAADNRTKFSGVLLTNLAEHNSTHKTLLGNWGASTANYQTFDYEDPYEISKLPNIDTIMFVAKYEVTDENHRTGTHWYNTSYNKNTDLNTKSYDFLSGESIPDSKDNLGKFELLRNIDGKPVDVYGNIITENFSTALFAVSVGNQDVGSNKWDTVWQIYNRSGTNVGYGNPASFIGVADGSQNAALKNKTVYVNYEKFLDSDEHYGNSGDRIDGRWLYSMSTDATSLRLRVATENESGNLTFMEDGINWAEINDGSTNIGELEEADTSNLTKILNLPNRTTEVTAKINPVGYKVTGFYMLGDKYSGSGNNGFSTDIADYNNLNVVGTATNFVNSKDNRMVIVVEKIPDTDLVITHQMYGGPGAHKIKGFYYVKAELLNSGGTTVKTYNSGNYTNKPLTLTSFTTDAPKNGRYTLKVSIRTVMSGSASFNQWYENDHNNGYREIDSKDAHGSTAPVEKVIEIDVDSLYGENSLSIKNLDYYSDLQAAGSVNINHLLLPETISAGLSGTAYTQVTVVNSSGDAVSGGSYAAKASTTEVGSDFITTDNANNSYKLKVEIWTIPDSPAEFDKFYKDTTTEMTTSIDSSNNISYTIGQTKTFNDTEYTAATVMIPIRYFFKEVWDEDEQINVLQFDSSKQNFDLYSSLELGYEYEITYTYPSKIWKGDQAYKVTGYFTADEFQLLNAARNGFNSENDKKTFIYSKAPYEDNYRQVLSWNCSSATVNVDSSNAKKLIIGVDTTAKNDTAVKLTIQLPLAATLTGEGTDNAKFEPTLTDGKVIYDVANGFNKDNIVLTYMTHPRYSINGVKEQIADEVYLQAPQSVVKNVSDEQKVVYFSYWSLKDQETNVEYARCYSQNLNSAFYKDTIAVAVYENETKEAFDTRVPTENDKTAKIEILEQSRNQWTDKLSTNAEWDSADRLISDYLLTFTYNGKTIKNISGMKYGILFESAGNLDVDATTGEYITDSAHYSTKDNADAVTAAKTAASTFLNSHDSSDGNYLLSIKNASTMDNKNQVEYAYTIAGNNELHRELKYYRVYAFLKTSTGEITISDPIYLTIYDVASIQNGSAEMQRQMNND